MTAAPIFAPDTRYYCRHCGAAVLRGETGAHGLCNACYAYSRDHDGAPRPPRLLALQAARQALAAGRAPRCQVCNVAPSRLTGSVVTRSLTGGRCRACYFFRRAHGRDKRTAPCPSCGERADVQRVED